MHIKHTFSTFIWEFVYDAGGVEYEQTLELVVNGTSSDKLVFSKANITTTTTAATSSARKLLDSAGKVTLNYGLQNIFLCISNTTTIQCCI